MQIMGILNVTPDSFSDGGRYLDAGAAIEHAHAMVQRGAHIIDVGGESTRPGSQRVGEEEERRRVLPVVKELTSAGISVSIDTMNAGTARMCVDLGVDCINDVSAGHMDPRMLPLAASSGVDIVLMHWRGLLSDPAARFHYTNVVEDVRAELIDRMNLAVDAGVDPERIILDPGLGFSKNAEHNWEIVAGMHRFMDIGPRVLIAGSRKRFLVSLIRDTLGDAQEDIEAESDAATAALTSCAAAAGAWGVRVHDVRSSVVAAAFVARTRATGWEHQ